MEDIQNKYNIENSIFNRLQKLKVLVERGVDGEAINAKEKLEKALAKYGITLEEFLRKDEEIKKWKVRYKNKTEKQILYQCFIHLFGSDSEQYKNSFFRYRNGEMALYLGLTKSEYILFSDFYNFHCENWKEILKDKEEKLFMAYIHKNKLFDSNPSEEKVERQSKQSSTFSLADLEEILSMAGTMKNKEYYKKIENY